MELFLTGKPRSSIDNIHSVRAVSSVDERVVFKACKSLRARRSLTRYRKVDSRTQYAFAAPCLLANCMTYSTLLLRYCNNKARAYEYTSTAGTAYLQSSFPNVLLYCTVFMK